MRALELWNGLISWRWTPTVGLVLGSVLYAVIAIAIIPDHIGAKGPSSKDDDSETSTARHALNASAAVTSTVEHAGEEVSADDSAEARKARRDKRKHVREEAVAKRGFSPPLPRAEPEPAPAPEPPPPPVVPPTPIDPPTTSTQRVDVSPALPETAPAAPATDQAAPAPTPPPVP